MPHGLRTINDSGIVQIDENFRNVFVVAEGSVTTATGSINSAFLNISPAQTTCIPMVFVKPASGVEVGLFEVSRSVPPYHNIGPPWDTVGYQCSGAFDYKICGLNWSSPPSGDFGMVVYDDAANIVYDSRLSYMQIKSVHRLFAQANPAYQDITVPSDGEWFLMNNLRLNSKFDEFGFPARSLGGKYINSTTLRIHCYDVENPAANFPDYPGYPPAYPNKFEVDYAPCIVMTAKF